MIESTSRPEPGSQEAVSNTVVDNLGSLDEARLIDLVKSRNFLDEKEEAPSLEEQNEGEDAEEPKADDSAEEDIAEDPAQSLEEEDDVEESTLTRGVQKRINKLVSAKKAALAEVEAHKAQLQTLKQELEAAKASPIASRPDVSSAVEKLNTLEEVQAQYHTAVDAILWCEENANGGTITLADGTEQYVTDDEVKVMRRAAVRQKELELPARHQFIQQQKAAEAEAVKDFPWYNKPETEEYRLAQEAIRQFPEIQKRRADWKHVAGLLVLGIKSYQAMKKTPATAAPIKKAPAQPSVKAPLVPNKNADSTRAAQAFARNPSDKGGLSELLKQRGFI
jgi:hypothetical protein